MDENMTDSGRTVRMRRLTWVFANLNYSFCVTGYLKKSITSKDVRSKCKSEPEAEI